MSTTPDWVHELEAAKLLALKQLSLRNMRRERRLEAGRIGFMQLYPSVDLLFIASLQLGKCSVNEPSKRCKKKTNVEKQN